MYLDKNSLGGGINILWVNCTANGISCNIFDLAVQ
jgi:hypothetical protein